MTEHISSKMGEVADLPRRLTLNLQHFAGDGTPDLEDSPDYAEDMNEFDQKMSKYMSTQKQEEPATPTETTETPSTDPETDSKQAATPDVADPVEKPKQDSDTNKAFQEMRKQLEAEKARAAEIEAKAKKADELIAQQYGESHGIYTVEQYEQQLQREKENADRQRYEEAGLTPEEIQMLKEYPQLKQETMEQKQLRLEQEQVDGWKKLYDTYPEFKAAVSSENPEELQRLFNEDMKAEIARGASPLAAYRNAHFEMIMKSQLQNVQEIAKQEALDKLNSKEHLAPNASTGGEVDHVEIDEETMRAYRALNKGKTDAQIRAWHKKHAN
jgi:hypothetical protein